MLGESSRNQRSYTMQSYGRDLLQLVIDLGDDNPDGVDGGIIMKVQLWSFGTCSVCAECSDEEVSELDRLRIKELLLLSLGRNEDRDTAHCIIIGR